MKFTDTDSDGFISFDSDSDDIDSAPVLKSRIRRRPKRRRNLSNARIMSIIKLFDAQRRDIRMKKHYKRLKAKAQLKRDIKANKKKPITYDSPLIRDLMRMLKDIQKKQGQHNTQTVTINGQSQQQPQTPQTPQTPQMPQVNPYSFLQGITNAAGLQARQPPVQAPPVQAPPVQVQTTGAAIVNAVDHIGSNTVNAAGNIGANAFEAAGRVGVAAASALGDASRGVFEAAGEVVGDVMRTTSNIGTSTIEAIGNAFTAKPIQEPPQPTGIMTPINNSNTFMEEIKATTDMIDYGIPQGVDNKWVYRDTADVKEVPPTDTADVKDTPPAAAIAVNPLDSRKDTPPAAAISDVNFNPKYELKLQDGGIYLPEIAGRKLQIRRRAVTKLLDEWDTSNQEGGRSITSFNTHFKDILSARVDGKVKSFKKRFTSAKRLSFNEKKTLLENYLLAIDHDIEIGMQGNGNAVNPLDGYGEAYRATQPHKSRLTGLYEQQINALLRKYKKYGYYKAVAADEIKAIPWDKSQDILSFVFNTTTRRENGSGGHWVACFISRPMGMIAMYDSIADKLPTQTLSDIIEFVKKNTSKYFKLKINGVKDQGDDYTSCGYHAVRFIEDMYQNGGDFKAATKWEQRSLKGKEEALARRFPYV